MRTRSRGVAVPASARRRSIVSLLVPLALIATLTGVPAAHAAPGIAMSGGEALFVEAAIGHDEPVAVDPELMLSGTVPCEATVTITANHRPAEDVLALPDEAASTAVVSAFDATTGELSLTAPDCLTDLATWEAALRAVTYVNTSDAPDVNSRTVTVELRDGESTPAKGSRQIAVVATNDPPVLTLPSGELLVWTSVPTPLRGLAVSDADAGESPVELRVSVFDQLSAASSDGVTVTGSGTSDLVLTGSVGDLNAYLAAPSFRFGWGFYGKEQLAFTLDDLGNSGAGGAATATGIATASVLPPPPSSPPEAQPQPVPTSPAPPAAGLPRPAAGTATLTLGEQAVAANVAPNAAGTTLTITAGEVAVSVGVVDGTGGAVKAVSGSTLVLGSGDRLLLAKLVWLREQQQQQQQERELELWLNSEPILLGSIDPTATEQVVALPDDLPVGAHTLRLASRDPAGNPVVLSLGVLVAPPLFADVAADSPHAAAIRRFAALEVVSGLADGSFAPSAPTTRGQFASLLARAFGLVAPAGADRFSDAHGSPHAEAIEAVAAAGIARGYGDGRFGAGDPIRHDHLATMLAGAAGLAPRNEGPFRDLAGNAHAGAINALADAGILESTTTFGPDRTVRRDEAASLLARSVDRT